MMQARKPKSTASISEASLPRTKGFSPRANSVEQLQGLLSMRQPEGVCNLCEQAGFSTESTGNIEIRKLTAEEEEACSEIANKKDFDLVDGKQQYTLVMIVNGNQKVDVSYKSIQAPSSFENGSSFSEATLKVNNSDSNSLVFHSENQVEPTNIRDPTTSEASDDTDIKVSFDEITPGLWDELIQEITEDQSRLAILELIDKSRRLKETFAAIGSEIEVEVVHSFAEQIALEVINECQNLLVTTSSIVYESVLTE